MENNQQNVTETVNETTAASEATAPVAETASEQLTPEMSVGDQLLSEIRMLSKKQVLWHRLSALFMMGILLVLLATVVVLLPRILQTLHSIDSAVAQVTQSMDDVDSMIAEMTTASRNLNGLVEENAEPLTDAVTKMSEVTAKMEDIDFEGLNQAIKDLQAAVGPVANFFNKFR